jgi:hypothetical protein
MDNMNYLKGLINDVFLQKYPDTTVEIESMEFDRGGSLEKCRVCLIVNETRRTGRSGVFDNDKDAIRDAFEEAIQPKYTIGGLKYGETTLGS